MSGAQQIGSVAIAIERPTERSVGHLLAGGEAFARERYPADHCYMLPLDSLLADGVTVWVARVDDTAVGMVAAVDHSHDPNGAWAEVKRLYVDDVARGTGAGRALMDAVHAWARQRGVPTLRLETGPQNDAALHLYDRLGYERTGPFGSYPDVPASVFFRVDLA